MPPSKNIYYMYIFLLFRPIFSLSGTVNEYSTGFCKCKPDFSAFFIHYLYFKIDFFIYKIY